VVKRERVGVPRLRGLPTSNPRLPIADKLLQIDFIMNKSLLKIPGKLLPLVLLLACIAAYSPLNASLQLASLFQDGMVLQRDKPVTIWGTDLPNTVITIQLGDGLYETVSDESGHWQLATAPMAASFDPLEMYILGSSEITLRDILIGEVWIASGQSNMVWTIQRSEDNDLEEKGSDFPAIREFHVTRKVALTEQEAVDGKWLPATADNIGSLSAVAHFFARDIQAVEKVPVGIILAAWGGTRIEAWMTPTSLQEDLFSQTLDDWQQVLAAYPEAHERHLEQHEAWRTERDLARQENRPFNRRAPRAPLGPGSPQTPSGLFNAMIHPLSPYAIRGFLWYQGESNVAQANEYHARFSRMISDWRLLWKDETIPFYWVQLSSFMAGNHSAPAWAFLREAQSQTLIMPNTGQALCYDIGDAFDIHPQNKRTVGRRLARIALNQIHGHAIEWQGPEVLSIERIDSAYHIHFANADGGLRTTDATLQGFQIAGANRAFHDATAKIEGSTVIVQSPQVDEPVAVRFGWTNVIPAKLYNQRLLPALPFRSDDWPE
jgi:sialate O-acetylesterase